VDLFGALVALYAFECLVWLSGAETLLAVTPFGRWIASGPGLRLLLPRPSARCEIGFRFPLVELEGSLHARGGERWFVRGSAGPVSLTALGDAEAHARTVRVGRGAIARGIDASHAERLAHLLREIGRGDADQRRTRIEAAIRESLSFTRFDAARARVDEAAHGLAWTSDVYALALFGVTPAAVLAAGPEYALWVLAPALILLHGAVLIVFARAHAHLLPERRADRIQALLGAAIYPPAALRTHHRLRASALGDHHPATLAAALLPREAGRAFLRAELVHAESRSAAAPSELGFSLAGCERDALMALIGELGESPAALLRPPDRIHPLAVAYCPACRCEYRREGGECSDCRLSLERFPEAAR